jgi:thiamine biosynthesis lipoprotein
MRLRYLLILVIVLSILSCQSNDLKPDYIKWTGKTMGTFYSIVFEELTPIDQEKVDSIFKAINASVSTYETASLISRFNRSDELDLEMDEHFSKNLLGSKEIHDLSNGSFDPTVMPLVNYWGFGYTGHDAVSSLDSMIIDSIRQFTGMEHISVIAKGSMPYVHKDRPEIQLDFSGLAKGYAADVVASWMYERGIRNFLIEIGGDGLAAGKAKGGRNWRFGINEPLEDSSINSFYKVVSLSGKAIATSGNYRNYHEINGQKYGHTINPKTGYPEKSKLLSATIIAVSSIKADALATACMVKGLEESLDFIEQLPNTEGYFIYIDESATLSAQKTSGFSKYILADGI